MLTVHSKRALTNALSLVAVFLMMAAASIMRDGRLFGHSPEDTVSHSTDSVTAITTNDSGSVIINTSSLAANVTGYAGPVPVTIIITDGKIDSIKPLENTETPGFFKRVINSGILDRWRGLTPEEALAKEVDAVSGATFSSTALIANVNAGLSSYVASAPTHSRASHRSIEFYGAIAVILCAAIIPLWRKDKRYRLIQEILNVAVLGFWAGTFVDYTVMLGIVSNGLTASAGIITLLLLFIAFIYPLFGRPGHYCAWVCPLGSLQELASRCNPGHRLTPGPRTLKILTSFRMILWAALMICLWTGYFTSWIDYELFTAFMIREAATGVIIAGAVFIILSFFINRPYCRFICPTGTLLRMSQDINTK